jgi:hypothetical protein
LGRGSARVPTPVPTPVPTHPLTRAFRVLGQPRGDCPYKMCHRVLGQPRGDCPYKMCHRVLGQPRGDCPYKIIPSSFFLLPSSFVFYFSTVKNQDLIISIIQSKVAITCFNPASSCKRDNGKLGERLSVGSVGKDKPIELNLLRSSNHFGASLKGD